MDKTETVPMSTLRTVTLINHTQAPVRIRQARADVDVVDLTIPAMSRLRRAVTERQAENYVGLVSLVSGVAVLVHPRLAVRPSPRVSLGDCLREINNALNYWYPTKHEASEEERHARHVRLFQFRDRLQKELKATVLANGEVSDTASTGVIETK
jgi:hypothetical protein